ncbi:DUF3883 domain-containing protein [Klebsiella pneumoniae subsp. pneumoniae]|nr:DUF3883 domain-containing protein [Klebsiella pneumoniae subsp. pneumoniae]
MPAFEWVHVQLHQQKGMISLSPPTICNSAVKTTNGGVGSSFLVSHNELEFSKEAGDQFHLYRVFQFRDGPRLFTLPGDLSQHVHLKPTGTVANSRW